MKRTPDIDYWPPHAHVHTVCLHLKAHVRTPTCTGTYNIMCTHTYTQTYRKSIIRIRIQLKVPTPIVWVFEAVYHLLSPQEKSLRVKAGRSRRQTSTSGQAFARDTTQWRQHFRNMHKALGLHTEKQVRGSTYVGKSSSKWASTEGAVFMLAWCQAPWER